MNSFNPSRRKFVTTSAAGVSALALSSCGDDEEEVVELPVRTPGPPPAPKIYPKVSFDFGVASGDPLQDRIILWTCLRPEKQEPISVDWAIARDDAFADIVLSGVTETDAAVDYTVKVDAIGLEPGVNYYYRFSVGETLSPIGRTKTLPQGAVENIRLAVISCANYPAGYFNVYDALGQRDDIDVVLHLGDYLYEYPMGGYGTEIAVHLARIPQPNHEMISLSDYRRRHAQYKLDTMLQRAHAQHPFIAVWDDHEFANDGWMGGAQNHQIAYEGSWTTRQANAVKAYYEWMPIREPGPGRSRINIYREFQFGDLANLFMLETRLSGRSEPMSYGDDLDLVTLPFDFSDPENPQIFDGAKYVGTERAPAKSVLTLANIRHLPVPFDMRGETPIPVLDYALIKEWDGILPEGYSYQPRIDKFLNKLNDETRSMLGAHQESWLADGLNSSKQAGTPWQIIGTQSLFTPLKMANITDVLPEESLARLGRSGQFVLNLHEYDLPMALDSWSGYPAAQKRLMDSITTHTNNCLFIAGDSHSAWANEIPSQDGKGVAAIEFGTPSINATGMSAILGANRNSLNGPIVQKNPHVRFCNLEDNGFMILNLTRDKAEAEFYFINAVETNDYIVSRPLKIWLETKEGVGTGNLKI